MKTIGVLTCSLILGILYAEPGMSQTLPSHPTVQGKAIHPNEVSHGDFHARHPEARATSKGKRGAVKGAATKQCYKKLSSSFSLIGPIVPSQPDLNSQCDSTYQDECGGLCVAR